MFEVLNITLSAIALIVSAFALYSSDYHANKEYEYKVEPEFEISGVPAITISSTEKGNAITTMSEIYVNVLEKNNLSCAHVIYPDGKVEKMELEGMEDTLEGKIENDLDKEADIIAGEYEYRYFFLHLESLAGDSKIYIIYTKSSSDVMVFNCASGIEVYGFANEKEVDHEGERIMARKYVEIMKALPDYTGQ